MAAPDEEFELESCRACRGTGKVVSNLGGKPSEVDCPWCEGTGKFIGDHDAQARWGDRDRGEGAAAAGEATTGEGEAGPGVATTADNTPAQPEKPQDPPLDG
jgi:DnaJ-class molecular chaperone